MSIKIQPEYRHYPQQQDENSAVKTHRLPMEEKYLDLIKEGHKVYEGRICRTSVTQMKAGEHLSLFDKTVGRGVVCKITSIEKYDTIPLMLQSKGVLELLPQLKVECQSLSPPEIECKGIAFYDSIPNFNKLVPRFGVVAIGISYLYNFEQGNS